MIYVDKRTDVVKSYSEVEKTVRYLQERDAFGYRDIDDYIDTNFIVLDNYKDEEEIHSRLREIEYINEEIQELEEEDDREFSVREREIQELKREIELLEKEVEEITKQYPDGYWDWIIREYNR